MMWNIAPIVGFILRKQSFSTIISATSAHGRPQADAPDARASTKLMDLEVLYA